MFERRKSLFLPLISKFTNEENSKLAKVFKKKRIFLIIIQYFKSNIIKKILIELAEINSQLFESKYNKYVTKNLG